jgi:uncharacterized RDD family membrane protein YckC
VIIDGIAVLSIWVFVWLTMATRESLDVTTAALFISAISALYEVALIARFGQTAGKAVVGIAVVNVSGANPTIRQSVVRYIAKTLQPLVGISRWFRDPSRIVGALITQAWQIVLLVSVATDGRRQGLHDRVAQTWVVNVTLREPFRVRFRAAPGAQAELKIIEQSNIRKRRVRARR